jgi:tellurite resistance protein
MLAKSRQHTACLLSAACCRSYLSASSPGQRMSTPLPKMMQFVKRLKHLQVSAVFRTR